MVEPGDVAGVARTVPPLAVEDVRRRLGLDGRRRWLSWKRVALAVVLLVGIGGVVLAQRGDDDDKPIYKSETVERGALAVTVTGTGRLEARETVDVGTEVSGRVLAVHVDFNDRVKAGDLLAEIDTDRLKARVREAKAQLQMARAELRGAEVDAALAKKERERVQALRDHGLESLRALDAAEAAALRGAAAADTARARTSMAAAGVEAADNDVARARIVAPIDGIVLARNVEPGQTLASAFQVPVLFKIARDLNELRLHVRVDEADIARMREGQEATFAVEADAKRRFPSRVVSLRNVPIIEQGVVSYEAMLTVDNADGLLRPGMTATANIVTERVADALLVPNAALRFLPHDDAKREAGDEERGERKNDEDARHRVWTLAADGPVALAVAIGRTDGERTEVVGGELEAGTAVLVDVEEAKP